MRSCNKRSTIGLAGPLRRLRKKGRAARAFPLALPLWLAWLLLADVALGTPTNGPVLHSGLKPALEAAALDQSLVLLVFSAEWCGPCKLLERQTLAGPEFLEKSGLLHLVDIDVDADPKTARSFGVSAIPALFLLAADHKIVGRRTGLLSAAELVAWITEGRGRAKQGKWEGSLPGSKLDELAAKAEGGQLGSNDLVRAIAMLAEPDPAERAAAGKLLLEQREAAVAPLIEALGTSYLGVRISAAELLHHLAPDAIQIDPWQSPEELAEAVSALKKGGTASGQLPSTKTAREIDPAIKGSIEAALDQLGGDNLVRRTEAMSTLLAHGQEALPAVREALRAAEKAGDLRRLPLLEDVRWAILISEPVERSAGGVRAALARGKGQERQAAAVRLGPGGREAIPALAELAGDSDPLVVESAVRALSGIGGKDAIPAVAALLKAGDSNLRMTAAQGLGHTKNPEAVQPLLQAFEDPNEVVVTTALSALDEVNAENANSSSKPTQPVEVVQALKKSLSDPRWRVRAAAAEVIGKLGIKDLVEDLKRLGEDADGFVVKSALDALRQLGAAPEPAKLLAMARRHPGLREQVVQVLVNWGTDDAVQTVAELYNASSLENRLLILRGLAGGRGRERGSVASTAWRPLLARAAAEPEVSLRRAAAQAAAVQPAELAKALIPQFLADQDNEVRSGAAELILNLLSGERPITTGSHGFEEFDIPEMDIPSPEKNAKKTNEPPATAEQLAGWYAALEKQANPTNLLLVAARFVTGWNQLDCAALQTALKQADNATLARLAKSTALPAILPRLPWPEGRPLLERLGASPALFLRALLGFQKVSEPAAENRPEELVALFRPLRQRSTARSAARIDQCRLARNRHLCSGPAGRREAGSSVRTRHSRSEFLGAPGRRPGVGSCVKGPRQPGGAPRPVAHRLR